jgi:DNA-binding NarL/FixJ family response regulator
VALEILAKKRELIEALIKNEEVFVVLDYTLSDFETIEELLILNQRFPKTNWLLFSTELSLDLLKQIYFKTTNFSIVYKDCKENEIKEALEEFISSKRYVCNAISITLLNTFQRQDNERERVHLTATEKEILIDIASGKSTKEIAQNRFISTHTVVTHRKNIFRKIDVINVYEATKYAVKAGLINLTDYFI